LTATFAPDAARRIAAAAPIPEEAPVISATLFFSSGWGMWFRPVDWSNALRADGAILGGGAGRRQSTH
jgi:hypothetical protein